MQLLNTLYVTLPDSRLRLDNDTLRVEVEQETIEVREHGKFKATDFDEPLVL
jgi:hypothetical protein